MGASPRRVADPPEVQGLRRRVAEVGALWGIADLHERVTVVFSRRMTASLGTCTPARGRLALADRLRDGPPHLLDEVLVHEAAHAAAHLLHRRISRPHGAEWQGLMRRAGLTPRRQLDVPDELLPRFRSQRYVWQHRCPICRASRTGGRPVYEWRCQRCRRIGLPGVPRITRVPLDPAGP